MGWSFEPISRPTFIAYIGNYLYRAHTYFIFTAYAMETNVNTLCENHSLSMCGCLLP